MEEVNGGAGEDVEIAGKSGCIDGGACDADDGWRRSLEGGVGGRW